MTNEKDAILILLAVSILRFIHTSSPLEVAESKSTGHQFPLAEQDQQFLSVVAEWWSETQRNEIHKCIVREISLLLSGEGSSHADPELNGMDTFSPVDEILSTHSLSRSVSTNSSRSRRIIQMINPWNLCKRIIALRRRTSVEA
ncbi:hypothetical protein M422DRAFT_28788 [Sphaerobolus stellatus SS14]|nr:hypothetical protein M422DRAFT_28788 [Sphaerobolus stellatus SS14]